MKKMEKPDDEYFEDEQFRRRRVAYHDTKPLYESLKGYLTALAMGVVLGAAAISYVHRRSDEEKDKKEFLVESEIPLHAREPTKYFSIEAMVDGVGYDISRPLPPNTVPRTYHAVVRNKTLDGEHTEFRRPIEADAIEGLLDCIRLSLKKDKISYTPAEYAALVEKLPDLDVYGEYRTITRPDVLKACDRAKGGLKAIIGE